MVVLHGDAPTQSPRQARLWASLQVWAVPLLDYSSSRIKWELEWGHRVVTALHIQSTVWMEIRQISQIMTVGRFYGCRWTSFWWLGKPHANAANLADGNMAVAFKTTNSPKIRTLPGKFLANWQHNGMLLIGVLSTPGMQRSALQRKERHKQ